MKLFSGLRNVVVLGFGLLLAVLAVGGVLGLVNAARLTANERLVAHTHEVIGELEGLLSTLKDAETGQRGYLLTEKAEYLQPYEEALRQVPARLLKLKELTSDNQIQQHRLAEIEPKTATWLDELKKTVLLVRDRNRQAAMEMIRTDSGKAIMDDLRKQVAAMRETEEDLWRRRAEESRASARQMFVAIVLPPIIGMVLICVVFYLNQRNRRIRQLATEAIAEHRERLRTTLASIGDGVISTDAESRIININPVAEALTGWNAKEAIGQHLDDVFRIVNEETRQPVYIPAKMAIIKGTIVGLANHTALIAKDGSELPIDDSAAPIRCAKGEIVGAVLVFREVTERRQAERAARSLAAIVECSDDAIISKDINGIITSWNAAAERLFGYSPAEAIGRPVAMLAPPDRADEMPALLTRLRQGERIEHFDTVRRAKNGRLVPISLTVSPVKDKDGRIIGASKVARDISERKEAEAAVQKEREYLRVTLGSIGDAVITTDTEGNITFLNAVAESLTGWSRNDATGRSLEAVFHIVNEQTRKAVENPASRALHEGVIVGLANHTILIKKDGTQRPIDDSAAPIRLAQGQVIGCVLVFRDISARKLSEEERRVSEAALRRSEAALRAKEAELELVISRTPLLLVRCSRNQRYVFVNRAAAEFLGQSAEDIIGRPIVEVIGKAAFATIMPHVERVLRGEVVEYETEIPYTRTGPRFMHVLYTPDRDLRGEVTGWLSTIIDVTERKRQEEALRVSEERWRTMAEALPNLVWTDLPDGQCDWLSTQWGKYTGIPENELLGMRWLETVIHPDDRQGTLASWQEACADKAPYDLEYRIRRHDGEFRWFKTRGVPIRSEQGKIVYWLGTCTDIEDVKRLEAAIRESDQRKDEFLATLAHELRNPLAPLRNALELLRRSDDKALLEKSRNMMERQVSHMVRLVDDLLDISRITQGKLQLRKERVELAEVLDAAIEIARPVIDAPGHELTVTKPPQPVHVQADPIRLAQAFSNLLNNAAKYTEKAGHIWLTAERRGDEAVISVRDNGIGISAEHLRHIFTIFSQVGSALERSQGGLGVGLSLVNGLVELHGGTIEAHSPGPGKGSEFTIHLPVLDVPPETPQKPSEGETTRRGRKFRILVVDDVRDSADSMAMILQIMGHETRTAYDGPGAVQMAAAFQPDIVLLDIGLPKMNGYEVAGHIRGQSRGGNVALVALTGLGQEEDKRRSLEGAFDHHMTKPVEPAALEKLLLSLTAIGQS